MTCFSCHKIIEVSSNGLIPCPHCGAINFFHSSGAVLSKSLIVDTPILSKQDYIHRKSIHNRKRYMTVLICLSIVLIFSAFILIAILGHSKNATNSEQRKTASAPTIKNTSLNSSSSESGSSTTSPNTTHATPQPNNQTSTTTKTPTTISPSTPNPSSCTKAVYLAASTSNTDAATTGLIQKVDPAQTYTVYGFTAYQIRDQLNQCRPNNTASGEYDATTNWWFKSNYNWAQNASGYCSVSNTGLSIHISSILPQWTSLQYADSGLDSKWQTYISNLTTHEHGHRDLALQYSNTIYNGILNYPETDCSNIGQSLSNYFNNMITALNQAQDNYDNTTNHGATQGATFP